MDPIVNRQQKKVSVSVHQNLTQWYIVSEQLYGEEGLCWFLEEFLEDRRFAER